MWRRVRDADAAIAASSAAAPSKGRGRGRGINKRRAQDAPEGQPTPKKSTRGVDDTGLLEPAQLGPAPAKGLLASAAEAESHLQDGTPEEESVPASPEPPGMSSSSSDDSQAKEKMHAREKSPPLPKNLGEPDEYGFRTYNQRGPRERALTSRLMAPPIFRFNDWEIGFRDTYNDSSKGHTRAKRGKYLDTPNNTGMHFDHWCNGYDMSNTEPEEYDQELVAKHGIHPRYGIFLPTSTNDFEPADPCIMPGKPVVFIANPSGRVSHASRSLIPTMNHRRSEEAPLRLKFGAAMRRFCKLAEIDTEDVAISEYLVPDADWKKKSLGTAVKEMKRRPLKDVDSETDEEVQPEDTKESVDTNTVISPMSVLTYASAFVSAQDVTKTAPPPPKPARYDAIRDVFTDSKPEPAPVQETNSLNLNVLAELCNVEARVPGGQGAPPSAYGYDYKSPVKKEEAPPMGSFGSVTPSQPVEHTSPYTYSSSERAFPQPPSSGTLRETSQYPPPIDHRPPVTPTDYKQPPPIGHDHGYYYPPSSHSMSDARDPMSGRPIDPYSGHRMSSYGGDPAPPPPSYPRPYWPQHSPGPPPPIGQPPTPSQLYSAPPPPPSSHSRMSFSQAAANDPLPPLRPPRRNHSLPEEPMPDSRSSMHSSLYYPPGPSRSYHRGGFPMEPVAPLQTMGSDRILPNPQQGGQGYMGSPPPPSGYAPQMLSPTFGNPLGLPGQTAQSPPDIRDGGPGGIHRHRSTPSGSSDAGSNKYRKLQPAPVPAHRNWANKPELKTIPYDHKETGSSAALPSSGPTQIRGWNVNQPRKRSKAEKQERAEAAERDDSR